MGIIIKLKKEEDNFMSRIGIDFGTTNSYCAFYSNEGDGKLINIMKNNQPEPSLFFYKSNTGEIYGSRCKDYIDVFPNNFIKSIKVVLDNEEENVVISFEKMYIVQKYIEHLINDIVNIKLESIYEDAVDEVVLSFPVGFSEKYKSKIKKAVENISIKGTDKFIKVIAMIEEPVAAAIHYFYIMKEKNIETNDNVLVYDLGGGTFDAAIVHKDILGDLTVIDHQGIKNLGGDQWDELLGNHIIKRLEYENLSDDGLNELKKIKQKERDYIKFLHKVEELKMRLSEADESIFVLNCGYSIIIRRTDFEEETKQLIEKTLTVCETLINDNSDYPISQIILCGGSTYMPMIKENLSRVFPTMSINLHYPESAIAFGDILYKENDSVSTILKTNHSYGTRCFIGNSEIEKISNVIYYNEYLPVVKSKNFCTHTATDSVIYTVYEGNIKEGEEDYSEIRSQKLLKQFRFVFNYIVPKETYMDVIYTLDEMGILTLSVHSDNHPDQNFSVKVFEDGI